MTRKKSNVKALALAVTCAILAGGYSGLNPVYAAADTLYKEGANVTTSNTASTGGGSNTAIEQLTVGGVTIGGTGGDAGQIIAKNIVGITNSSEGTVNDIHINGATFASGGAITANGGLTTNSVNIGGLTISSLASGSTTSATNYIAGIKDSSGAVTAIGISGTKFESNGAITASSLKLDDGIHPINDDKGKTTIKNGETVVEGANGKVTINNGGIEIAQKAQDTGENYSIKLDSGYVEASGYVKAPKFYIDNDNKFEKNSLSVGEGTNSVKIGGGTITASKDVNVGGNLWVGDKFEVNTDGTKVKGNVTFNEGQNNQVKITDEGVVVGLGSTVIGSDGVYADGHTEATAKAVLGADGSIKGAGDGAGNYKFKVTNAGDVFSSSVTATLGGFNDVLINNGLAVGSASDKVAIGGGGIIATNGTDTVTVGNGAIVATGDITANGALSGASLATTGDITGANITASGALNGDSLNVTNDAAVGGNLAVAKNIKGQSLNIGATGDEFTVDTVGHMTSKSAQIGSVGINNTGVITGVTSLTTDALHVTGAFTTGGNLSVTGDLEASGAIKGKTISISDGGSIAGVSFATGGNLTATTGTIAGVSFATGGNVSGINNLTATGTIQGATLKVNNNNLLDDKGLKAEKAVIDSVVIDDASITSTGANGLDVEKVNLKNGAITANSATIGGVNTLDNTGIYVATGSKIQVGVNTVIEDGSIAVSTNTKLTDQALNLNAANKWTAAGGLEADKAAINGVTIGETTGKAVFNKAGKSTTIDGDTIETGKITADELLIDKISLGKNGSSNISIDKDGHVQTKGDIKITDAAGNVMSKLSQDQATFGNNADNQTNINNGKLNAKAKNTANQQAEFNFDENGLTVSGQNAAGATSSFGFNAANGIGTFTGQDATTTAINGSAITSTNGGATGVLDGSNLTLTNGANSTALTAGGATFTGAAGEKGGTTTTINGGTITTDTLNVERINLGEDILDSNGTPHGSNLSMDKQGNFSAAGGNFTVKGGTGTDKGAFTNKVGNTTLQTDTTGASMKYNNGTVESNVSVGDDSAKISAGASSIEVKNDGITNTGVTTFKGAVDSSVPTTETTINGNTIKTGHLITDKLTITGSGAAAGTGSGSIAFGGDGSITSNIKDAATGKEATFKTDETGTFTEAKDSAGNKTTNTVNAQGNTNKVTDGTNTSTATQTATSIGGVVTNGTVTMKQELTADGLKVEQTGYDEVNIAKGDVTVKNNRNTANPNQEVHLSDLGSLNNLDSELTARDEYKDNKTAVGAINAEAGIRREEVARLDNRIDDVNNRVDKVGAMAAAIASLKSIGYDPQAPSEFSIGIGQYKGETGVAMGFFHYPNKNFMINVSLSTAGGETMGGIGATWRFGHKSPQKLLEEQREAQAKKELAAAEKYQAAAKLAKEAQERAEYAAKLARQAQVSADNAKAAADATQAKHFQ
ncbi:YadA-like family protein [Phascolarctobacterium sp.]|uniref:YadA-like family protein n=1 Tax=Phascolarctobacterium sp. TaxID=2049039 RepID=UPI003F7DD262